MIISALYKAILIITTLLSNPAIDQYLQKEFDAGRLNGSVLVVSKGEKVFEKSYGFVDGSKDGTLNKDHKFVIGSIYKEFPAVAIMQLKEQGLIDLDKPISYYLNDYPMWSDSVSITNLLQYSAGLPKIPWNDLFSTGEVPNDSIVYSKIKEVSSLQFEPGTDYIYTNMCPLLLIKIIEVVSNRSFTDYLESEILTPLDLGNIEIKKSYPYADRENMAIPFDSDFQEDNYSIAVSSVLFSATAEDLYKWTSALDAYSVISEDSYKFLSKSYDNNAEYESPLGNVEWSDEGLALHAHHGSTANYECIVRNYKAQELSIVILTNQKNSNVHELSDEILKIMEK